MQATLTWTIALLLGPGHVEIDAEVDVIGSGHDRPYAVNVRPYQWVRHQRSPRLASHELGALPFGDGPCQQAMRAACLDALNSDDGFIEAASHALEQAREDAAVAAAEARAEWRAA